MIDVNNVIRMRSCTAHVSKVHFQIQTMRLIFYSIFLIHNNRILICEKVRLLLILMQFLISHKFIQIPDFHILSGKFKK